MGDKNVKIIKILSLVAIIQILLLIFVNVFSFSTMKSRKMAKPLLKGVNDNNITSFELKDRIDGFKVFKEKDQWFVEYEKTKMPGNSSKIDEYVKLLSNLKEGTVIYKGKDNSSDDVYGFNTNNIQRLTLTTAKAKTYKLEIGNIGPIKGSSYLRVTGENKIRLVDSTIKSDSNRVYKDWTNLRLFDGLTLNDFKSVAIKLDTEVVKEEYIVTREEPADKKSEVTYTITPGTAGQTLDQLVVKGLVNSIIMMQADNFKTSGSLDGKSAVGTIEMTLKDGKKRTVTLYPADKDDLGNYIATVDTNKYLYLFHEDTLKKIIKTKDDLYKK